MSKTKVNGPFGPWKTPDGTHHTLYRYAPGTGSCALQWLSIDMDTFRITGAHASLDKQFSTLGQAIDFADQYIIDNFEWPKTVAEHLKEAQAEIVALKETLRAS